MKHVGSGRPALSTVGLRAVVALGVLFFAWAEARGQSCTAPDFALPPVPVAVGDGPRGIAVLDIDRNGTLDLVTADALGGTISFGYGDGMGGFSGSLTTPVVAVQPWAVAVADFNLDGIPDVAISDLTNNTLQAFLGDGLGGVQLPPPAPVAVGAGPIDLAAGDFNRDGIPDLVSANVSGTVQIVTGAGNGTFAALAPGVWVLPGSPQPQALAVGDFNRNGTLDVVVADPAAAPAAVHLVLGNGAGGWTGLSTIPVPLVQPSSLATGDVDLDGDLDVVVGENVSSSMVTLLGDGGANLLPQAVFPVPLLLTTSIVLADVDSDGRLDLGATGLGSATVAVGLGDGAGGFGFPTSFAVAQDPFDLAVGDFDGDGRPDIVGSGEPADQGVLLLNQFGLPCPNASFAGAGRLQVDLGGSNPAAIVHGDWDGDAVPDVAIAHNNSISILLGDGTLRFGAPSNIPVPLATSDDRRSLVVADFDLDSRPDLATANPDSIVANDNSVAVLINNGGGTFLAPTIVPVGNNPQGVVAGDFNGDGAPDLVTADRGGISATFVPGRGDGTFGLAVTSPLGAGGITAIAAADIDGDLLLDIAVTHTAGNVVRWYKGDGAGGFTFVASLFVGNFPESVDLGDLNGDGLPDLVTANLLDDTVSVLLNTGGAFTAATPFPVGDEPHWVRIARADDDAFADLVVPNRASHDVTVLLGDGAGLFPTSTTVRGYQNPEAAIVFDADRNGKPDLAVPNWAFSGGFYILPGDGLGGFGPVSVSPGTRYRSVATGDFDRDGKPDLVTLDRATVDLAFVQGQGDGTFAAPATSDTGLTDPSGIGVGDFDRNGTLDLVVGSTFTASVSFVPGNGAGGFGVATPIPTGGSNAGRRIAVGDFDRDGALDFVKINGFAATVSVHYGTGAGGFTGPTDVGVGTSPGDIVVLDFDRDGLLDVAVSNFNSSSISLLEGTGVRLTPFTPRPSLVTGGGPLGLAAGDFDHDGVADLAVGQLSTTPASVGYFRGTGAAVSPFFNARTDFDLDATEDVDADGVAAADVNGDGWLDLLVACRGGANEERASVRVLAGTGDPTPGSEFVGPDLWAVAQRNPSAIAVDDFDRNGTPDFVTGSLITASNQVSVVLNTNCRARRLRSTRNVSLCNTPGVPFGTQPAVQVEDDGANPILCNDVADPVSVGIVPGTGTGGALLTGDNPLATTSGVADWVAATTPLSIDLSGNKYRLEFAHPLAGLTHSRSFSLAPSLSITGPADYCAASSGFFSTDPGFDTYRWFVDPPASPASFGSSLTIGAGALAAAPHTIQVDATVDTCPATDSQPFTTFADLSTVSVAPPGSFSICTSCTGPTLTVTETGGGALTRRWGYRAQSGGAITYLPGETGTTYDLEGVDFPGPGTYYVVVETTPQCGVVTVSAPEVVVAVTQSTPADVPPVLSVTSTGGQNHLEWVYPAGRSTVRIRYRTNAAWLSCTPPETELVGFADIPDQTGPVGGKDSFTHGSLTNDTTYCYSVFVDVGGPSFPASTRRTVKGRPFATGGPVKWAYTTGASSMAPPGLGAGVIHAVSQDDILHSAAKGLSGGTWPPGWTPFVATGPSQARPTTVPLAVPPASGVNYLGSQAGAGNNTLAVDADTGLGLWGQPLGQPIQAGPAGIFTAYGGSLDAILIGTRDGGGPNVFHALDPVTGNSLGGAWPYNGEPPGNEIGIVNSQAAVDYLGDRVFFTSFQRVALTSDSVWCVELGTAARCPLWPVQGTGPLGNIAASPTLRGGVLYVSPIVGVDGEIQALDADDGSTLWASSFKPTDGQIKLFILPDFFSTDLYFSTTTSVWSIRDDGGSGGLNWQRATIPSPSQPVFFAGTGRVYVGGGDGRLYILNASDGLDAVAPIILGEPGLAAVGAPTVDQAGGFVYVGTDAGVVYAVEIP